MTHRFATLEDVPLLAELNHQLIQDQRHRNPMNVRELAQRMTGWLASGEYSAILFEDEKKEVVAYALYREQQQPAEIYLRQFFVTRHRRRQSLGRKAFLRLRELWPKNRRITVEVLAGNKPALEFFRSVGYVDYSVALEIMPAAVPH